jgi:hypothetical protein
MHAQTGCAVNGARFGLLSKQQIKGFSKEVQLGPDSTSYWLADNDEGHAPTLCTVISNRSVFRRTRLGLARGR